MKVFYDHQVFTYQNFGGISRYFFELISYAAAKNIPHHLSLFASNNVFAKDLDSNVYPFFKSVKFPGKTKVLDHINRFKTVRDLKSVKYDLFHPTFYNNYFLDSGANKKPLVVTCCDMINERFEQFFQNDPTAEWKKRQLEAATVIITISENTKRDIIDILGVPKEKIFVTPLASSFKVGESIPDNPEVDKLGDYILYVGIRHLYKNFIPYVESVAPILKESSVKLICAGGGAFTEAEQALLKKLEIQDKVIQLPIDDLLLTQLYKNAITFVFPSTYEGFGIPTLEAFSVGSPVLLANAGSLPEVGGDAAAYFDPYDQNSMYQVTRQVLNDATYRSQLKEKGLARAAEFSWDKTARLTFDVYDAVVKG